MSFHTHSGAVAYSRGGSAKIFFTAVESIAGRRGTSTSVSSRMKGATRWMERGVLIRARSEEIIWSVLIEIKAAGMRLTGEAPERATRTRLALNSRGSKRLSQARRAGVTSWKTVFRGGRLS